MTRYIVDWLGIAGENERVFSSREAALSFVKQIQWEALSEVIITEVIVTEEDDNEEYRKGDGQ